MYQVLRPSSFFLAKGDTLKFIIQNSKIKIMDKFELQKLRDLSIVGVAERLGLRVDDHHPSMALGRRNHYRCFVCDAHGDVIDLVMRFLNKTFTEACHWLADESNIILTEYRPKETEPKPFNASR